MYLNCGLYTSLEGKVFIIETAALDGYWVPIKSVKKFLGP